MAWYPIYRVPEGNFRAAFLTFHSLGHLMRRSARIDSQSVQNCIVCPVVGLQSYNAQVIIALLSLCKGNVPCRNEHFPPGGVYMGSYAICKISKSMTYKVILLIKVSLSASVVSNLYCQASMCYLLCCGWFKFPRCLISLAPSFFHFVLVIIYWDLRFDSSFM